MDAVARAVASGEDLYGRLGVDAGASAEEIRRAYRRLARSHHPDVHPGGSNAVTAGAGFGRIAAAYEILGDERARAAYDRVMRSERVRSAQVTAPGPVAVHAAPRPTGSVGSRGRAASANPADHAPRGAPAPTRLRTPVDEWRLVSVLGRFVAAALALVIAAVIVLMVVTASASEPEPAPPTIWCKTPDGWHDCWSATSPDGP